MPAAALVAVVTAPAAAAVDVAAIAVATAPAVSAVGRVVAAT